MRAKRKDEWKDVRKMLNLTFFGEDYDNFSYLFLKKIIG